MILPSSNTTEQAPVPSGATAPVGRSNTLSDATRLAAIIATQNAIATSDLDLPSLMQLIAERTRELTEADGAAFELREADEMVYRAACGTTAAFLGLRLPVRTSLSGRSVMTGEILKCDDSETDPRVDREACRKVGARSMIVVPLRYQGKVQGVLKVLSGRPAHFDSSDVQTLEMMAGLLAALVSHASAFRAQQEETAERERERLAEIFLRAPAFMAVLRGPEHIFERANPPYLQLVGYRDLIGKPIREALPEIVDQGFYEFLDEVYRTGKPYIGKDRRVLLREIPGAPMRERYLDFVYQPLIEADGSVSGIFVHGVDLTERKHVEQTLQTHAQEIADLNQRLQHAMRETHHRVKNNLQIVSAMIDMQMVDHQDDGSVPLAEFVRLNAHIHTLAIVHDLLTLTVREEEGAQRVSTKAALERLLPMLQQTAWQQEIRYSVEEIVLTSRQCIALSLILNELVSNALKHGRHYAEVLFTAKGGQGILVVCDDGPGFPEGFDIDTTANTGLELVVSLARTDLRGTLAFSNQPHGGGQVVLTFTLPEREETIVPSETVSERRSKGA